MGKISPEEAVRGGRYERPMSTRVRVSFGTGMSPSLPLMSYR